MLIKSMISYDIKKAAFNLRTASVQSLANIHMQMILPGPRKGGQKKVDRLSHLYLYEVS